MKKIVISYPDFFNGEVEELISVLNRSDIWRLHIRKPGHSMDEVGKLLDTIPAEFWTKISIHNHLELANEYGLGGVHLNSYNPTPPDGWTGLVSRSFHTVDEIGSSHYDYAFLSPVFPSISKPGYSPTLTTEELSRAANDKIFALGGVTYSKLPALEKMGFGGAAFLGDFWRRDIDMKAFRLQFITHPVDSRTIEKEVEEVLDGGCRWVQLRHKKADTDTLLREGRAINRLCQSKDAIFIIDDRVDLVDTVGADGVHLGRNDMPVKEARHLLGPRKIIGATANCFEDIRQAYLDGADYIGLGPFRFTTTKTNLSPVLGLEGYREIVGKCKAEGIPLPIVAIGGITEKDVSAVMRTGVKGIAISSEIISAENPAEKTCAVLGAISAS